MREFRIIEAPAQSNGHARIVEISGLPQQRTRRLWRNLAIGVGILTTAGLASYGVYEGMRLLNQGLDSLAHETKYSQPPVTQPPAGFDVVLFPRKGS